MAESAVAIRNSRSPWTSGFRVFTRVIPFNVLQNRSMSAIEPCLPIAPNRWRKSGAEEKARTLLWERSESTSG